MVVRISDKMRYYSKVTKLLVKPKEIEERIAYEIFKYQDFVSNNQQNYLYCLMDEDEFIYGVYESFDLAYDNLKQKVHEDLNDDFFSKKWV